MFLIALMGPAENIYPLGGGGGGPLPFDGQGPLPLGGSPLGGAPLGGGPFGGRPLGGAPLGGGPFGGPFGPFWAIATDINVSARQRIKIVLDILKSEIRIQ